MGEMMDFPETFDEFAENYKITDDKQVYTNGTELIPIFRVRQWLMRPDENAKTVEQIKSEAVKEFAERLKNKIKTECNPYGNPTFDYDTSVAIMHYIDKLISDEVWRD